MRCARTPSRTPGSSTSPTRSGIVTRALLQEGHRAVGLCNVAIGFQRRFAGMLDVTPDEVTLGHVGLNHLTWIRSVTAGGVDHLPRFFEHLHELAEEVELPAELLAAARRRAQLLPALLLRARRVLDEQLHSPSRADAVQAVERELLALYADPSVDTKPAALEQRGGAFYSEAAIELLSGLVGGIDQTRVVNLRNGGTLPFLPDDHVIEVPARVTAAGVEALPVAPLDDDIRGLDRGGRRLRAPRPRRGRPRRARARPARDAGAPAGAAVRPRREADRPAAAAQRASTWRGRDERARSSRVDGGGSKTHAVALTLDGELVGRGDGPGSSPHWVGVEASIDIVDAAGARGRSAVGRRSPRPTSTSPGSTSTRRSTPTPPRCTA